jgi:hypothetical protein
MINKVVAIWLTIMVAVVVTEVLVGRSAVAQQWDYSRVEGMHIEAQALIEEGQIEAGLETYEDILFLIRVEKGVYSTEQLPYLLETMEWRKVTEEWDSVLATGKRVRWLLGRNENQAANYRLLLLAHVYDPADTSCLSRDPSTGSFIKSASDCSVFRYFMADTFIAATEIQQKLLCETGLPRDVEALRSLAVITSRLVRGVDGPPTLIKMHDNALELVDNLTIRERYRPDTWVKVANKAGELR